MAFNPQVAWGSATVEYGTIGTGGALPTTWKTMGCIVENTLGLAQTDGTPLDLFCAGHVQIAHKAVEKELTMTGTIAGANVEDVMKDFWVTEEDGAGDIVWVNSTQTNSNFAFRLSVPDVAGSDRLIIPSGAMNLGMGYADNQGFTLPFTITLTMGELGHLMGWDRVPATPAV